MVEINWRTVDFVYQYSKYDKMNTALKVILIVSVVGICSSFPQQGNAPPGRPYRDTSGQVNPPGSLEGPQVEDLHSTDDHSKGSQTKDVPKDLVRESRQTKDVPKDTVATGTKDIPKDTHQSRVARQAQTLPYPPPRPALPGSAGEPQVQPIRESRQTKDVPKQAPQTRPVLPGSAGQPQVQPIRQARQTKDVAKDQPQTRPALPGSAGQPQVQPIRQSRQTKDVPKDQPQTKPVLPGSAGQPQVQPIRPDRVTRQTKDVPKDSVAAGTKDLPKEDHRPKRQAQQIPQPLPGSAGQPQTQPPRQTRQTKDVPKDSAAAGTKDLPKEDHRPKRQAQPIPQPLPGSAGQPQTQPPRQTRQTKDVPKDVAAAGTKDLPKDGHRDRRDTDHASDDAVHVPIPQPLPAQDHAGQHTKDVPKSPQ